MKSIKLILFSIILVYSSSLSAQEHDGDALGVKDLVDVNSEDLINGDVVTASKSEENINTAPGAITVITKTEIEKLGGNNILELIERVVSIYHTGSYFAPLNAISIRGDLTTHYNNHVLILLNGRPVREMLIGGVDFPILLSFPLQVLDRVEIIRGPGSALYGTNAYAGVINLIVGESGQDETVADMQYGSFGTTSFSAMHSKVKQDLKVSSGINFRHSDGWNVEAVGEDLDTMRYQAGMTNVGGSLTARYKDFTVNSFVSFSQQNHMGVLPQASLVIPVGSIALDDTTITLFQDIMPPFKNRKIQVVRSFMDIGYEHEFSKADYLTVNATFNSMHARFATPNGDWVGNSRDLLLEATNFYNSESNKLSWMLGASGYYQDGLAEIGDDSDRGISPYSKIWYSAYTQLDIKPSENLKFIVGGQLNKPSGVAFDFVPRLGVISNFTEHLGIKVLYGQAFRSPTEIENNLLDVPVLAGNPDLRPEKVATFDAQLFYNSEKIRFTTTYFNTLQKNLITQGGTVELDGGVMATTYTNGGRLAFQGIEAEVKYVPFSNFYLSGSFSFQSNILDDSIKNATHVPQGMFKLGAFYEFDKGVSIGVFNSYFTQPVAVTALNDINTSVRPFHYMTANIQADLLKLLSKKSTNNAFLKLYMTNVLNESIHYPEFVREGINSIPGRSGRATHLSLLFKF